MGLYSITEVVSTVLPASYSISYVIREFLKILDDMIAFCRRDTATHKLVYGHCASTRIFLRIGFPNYPV